MTGNHVVDLALVTLGPLIVWQLFWISTRKMDNAEALILGALCVAPGETLTEIQLQRSTGLSKQELAIALNRMQDRVHCSNGRVTLR